MLNGMSRIDVSKIKLSQLRAFAAVAHYKNFSEAAASLDLTQSSVSYAIAALESELGVVLFVRGRQGATLTHVGEQICAPVEQMLALLSTVAERAIASRGAETGQVRIASIGSLATHWLPSLIGQFNQQYAQINVTLTKCFDHVAVEQALKDRSADIGLMDIYESDGYAVVDIGTDPYVLLLPAGALPPEQPVTWAWVRQHPLIMPSPSDHGYDDLRDYLASLTPALNVAYEINEDAVIVSMVAQKLGVAILPYFATLPLPEAVQVRHLPAPLSRRLAAVTREDALHPPAVFLFLDLMKRYGQDVFEAGRLPQSLH